MKYKTNIAYTRRYNTVKVSSVETLESNVLVNWLSLSSAY